jgi:hypothetical protein
LGSVPTDQPAGAIIFLLFELQKPFSKPFLITRSQSSNELSGEILMLYAARVQWKDTQLLTF